MPRALSSRRVPRPHPTLRRQPHHRRHGALLRPVRTSELVLALLGVALLGALALAAVSAAVSGLALP